MMSKLNVSLHVCPVSGIAIEDRARSWMAAPELPWMAFLRVLNRDNQYRSDTIERNSYTEVKSMWSVV
jgi:hypothetical protein